MTSTGASSDFSELPVLNLPSPGEEDAFCAQLRDTCHNIGFFYIGEHGVPPLACDGALDAAIRFFALPDKQKEAMDNRNSPAFRGYVRLGAENTAGLPDYREQVEFGVEKAAPDSRDLEAPPYRCLVGPNQWPTEAECPGFKSAMIEFLSSMENLSRRLMHYLALSLDLSADFFEPTFGDEPNVQMKIARYPPAPPGDFSGSEHSDGVGCFGVGAHTDSGYLSILLQDDVGGLQVQNGKGEWIEAPPMPGKMVVNLGEMIQLMTGGFYLATPHRVVSRPPTQSSKDRISVPYFWNPRLDALIVPIKHLPDTLVWCRPKPPAIDSTESHGRGRNALFGVYGANALKSLARSHPEVMKRHHPDLQVMPDGEVVHRRAQKRNDRAPSGSGI